MIFQKSPVPLQWMRVMGEDIFELYQPSVATFGRRQQRGFLLREPSLVQLPRLSLPSLRRLHISDHPKIFTAAVHLSSVRELTVDILGYMPPKELFEAFSRLRLVKLSTICRHGLAFSPSPGPFRCPFQDREISASDSDLVSKSLPYLKTIEICCKCYGRRKAAFWGVLPSLKTLKEVAFRWDSPAVRVPKETIRFLSMRDSVRITSSRYAYQLASLIGGSVSEITSLDPLPAAHGLFTRESTTLFTTEQVHNFRNYPRLRTLRIKIREGADVVLPEVVQRLPELNRLELWWVPSGLEEREPCKYSGYRFVTAQLGVMLRTIASARQLSKLCIARVRIPLTEMVRILKLIGRQLREFETSICDQEESPYDRLEAILLTTAEHNTELRELEVLDMEQVGGPMPSDEWRGQARRVLGRLHFLEKRAPNLVVSRLEQAMQTLTVAGW